MEDEDEEAIDCYFDPSVEVVECALDIEVIDCTLGAAEDDEAIEGTIIEEEV